MRIADNERAFLVSKMSDEAVASIFGQTLRWVKTRRAFLEGQPAEPPEPKRRGRPPETAPSNPEAKSNVPWRNSATARAARKAAKGECPPPPMDPAEPRQIDLEEAIAAAEELGPCGAPGGLRGALLADWLVTNSTLDFADIAARTGLTVADVERLADGEAFYDLSPPAAAPAVHSVKVTARVQKPAASKTPKPAPAVKSASEIPARTTRWVRQFLAAGWTVREVAHLFDLKPTQLQTAIGAT